MPPGTYYVKISAGGGAAVNTALSINVFSPASVYGYVVPASQGAVVSALGPGAQAANYTVTDPTGFFQIYGLQNGGIYTIQASSIVAVSSGSLTILASAANVTAVAGGTNVGNLSFISPSMLQVAAFLPFPAPFEIFGKVVVHSADYSQSGTGMLHFAQGYSSSDNGVQQFGQTAGGWTSISLPPGTYEADVNLPGLNISTAVTGVVVNPGQATQLPIALSREANVYGYVILPSTVTSASISVQAQQQGQSLPTVFGGAFVNVSQSSAIYSLFGLLPGSWTVTAMSQGYHQVSSSVYISSSADIGTQGCCYSKRMRSWEINPISGL